MLFYGLSGFIALSFEIVWFRVLGVMEKATSFTFGTLLSIYLGGLAAGTLLGAARARRSRTPARTFLALQAGAALYAALALAAFLDVLGEASLLKPLWAYFGEYEPLGVGVALKALLQWVEAPGGLDPAQKDLAFRFVVLYFLLPVGLIGPSTLMMGLSFPFLQKVVQRDPARLGRHVGWLQTANISGSMLGALVSGFLLLHVIGTAWTLKALVAVSTFYLWGWVSAQRTAAAPFPWARAILVSGVPLLALLLIPSPPVLWAKLHGARVENITFTEDETGVALIKKTSGSRSTVFVNGAGESWVPYGGIHSWLGFVPAILHAHPSEMAIIGLGSGDTVFSAAGREETQSITCVEIVRSQLATLARFGEHEHYPGIENLLHDARVHFVFGDGRAFLRAHLSHYDVIEADALRPHVAYAGNLYSYEYFLLLKDHLKPGGIAVSWAPTGRVIRTFVKAFPHVLVFEFEPLTLLVGSASPIAFDPDAIRARALSPFVQQHYQGVGLDAAELATKLSQSHPRAFDEDFGLSRLDDINRDLFPKDEFLVARR